MAFYYSKNASTTELISRVLYNINKTISMHASVFSNNSQNNVGIGERCIEGVLSYYINEDNSNDELFADVEYNRNKGMYKSVRIPEGESVEDNHFDLILHRALKNTDNILHFELKVAKTINNYLDDILFLDNKLLERHI